jgi:hypothetical protein
VADTLKDRCNRRLDSLKRQRRPYEPDWHEIAGYCAPARSRFLAKDANKGRRSNRRLNNGYGILAFRTLQHGMTAGLSSKSRPWFSLSLYNQVLLDNPLVKAWLDDVQNRMEAFLAHTNFYEAVEIGYLELGMFGTEACVMLEDQSEVAVCHALTAGEYWIGLNKAMKPGALYRDSGMTVYQAVKTFGKGNLSQRVQSLYDKSDYDCVVPMFHVIEENDDHLPGKLGPLGKPWRSIHFEGWDNQIGDEVKSSGFEEQPFWAPRWSTTGADTYGQGPGHDALPDLRELQLQAKREGEITDLLVWPEKVVSSKVKLKNQPKSIVSTDVIDAQKMVTVPYQVPPAALEAVINKSGRLEQRIAQISFADLFMAISDMEGVQPRNNEEINARLEEKMTQLGPVIERVNGEKLTVAIERTFGIMQRRGLIPPAPDALRNSPDLKIEFVSILTQMQRAVGLSQIERTVQFVGGVAGMYPEARFKLDPNAIVDEYASRAGMPPKLVRSDEDAKKDADAEKQAQQNAQMAEMMNKVGKPTKDLTDAAALAANLPVARNPVAGQQQ